MKFPVRIMKITRSTLKTAPVLAAAGIFILLVLTLFIFFGSILIPCIILMFAIGFIWLSVRNTVKIAFADPEDVNYVRKSNRQLYIFLLQSCITAYLFAVISFNIFIYVSLLLWFYFIVFMIMFSRVWKFHGKKRSHLFIILGVTVITSFISAPFIRNEIMRILNF